MRRCARPPGGPQRPSKGTATDSATPSRTCGKRSRRGSNR